MKKLSIIFLLVILIIIACSTPYQPKGILGGYSDKQLDNNCYKVSFWGNQHTKSEDVDRYLMYRCAKLSQEKGYDYFVIIDEERNFNKQHSSIKGSKQGSGGSKKSSGSARSNVRWTEYDFNYIIMLCDEVKEMDNKAYNSPQILQDLAVYINK